MVFTGFNGFAQVRDSVKSDQNKKSSTISSDNNGSVKQNEIKDNSQVESQTIKQVKGARPDMSKSRGARPPYIERQAGSGIPKGIGKPGGASGIKPGKR